MSEPGSVKAEPPSTVCAGCGAPIAGDTLFHTHQLRRPACGACLRQLNYDEIEDESPRVLAPEERRRERWIHVLVGIALMILGVISMVGLLTVVSRGVPLGLVIAPSLLVVAGLWLLMGRSASASASVEQAAQTAGHPFRQSAGTPDASEEEQALRLVGEALAAGASSGADAASIMLRRDDPGEPVLDIATNSYEGSSAAREELTELAHDLAEVLDRRKGAQWRTLTIAATRDQASGTWSFHIREDTV